VSPLHAGSPAVISAATAKCDRKHLYAEPKNDEERCEYIRRLFANARRNYPLWDHRSLLRNVWRWKPEGTNVIEMARIAEEFRLPQRPIKNKKAGLP
jgi:hypothetical protein